jgi:hypothetical protein
MAVHETDLLYNDGISIGPKGEMKQDFFWSAFEFTVKNGLTPLQDGHTEEKQIRKDIREVYAYEKKNAAGSAASAAGHERSAAVE